MTKVSYHSGVAQAATEGLGATRTQLLADLEMLGGFVASLSANWEGDEMQQYQQIQANWDNAAEQIQTILGQIEKALADNTASVDQMRSRVRTALMG